MGPNQTVTTHPALRKRGHIRPSQSWRRELLFQVLTEREEKSSVAIASNESFGGWTKTFTDPLSCSAIVDRLTFGGQIIETGTQSYRLIRTAQVTGHTKPAKGTAQQPTH